MRVASLVYQALRRRNIYITSINGTVEFSSKKNSSRARRCLTLRKKNDLLLGIGRSDRGGSRLLPVDFEHEEILLYDEIHILDLAKR